VLSALISSQEYEPALLAALSKEWGDIDLISERMAFGHTNYYEAEMGPDIYRRLISFRGLVPADALILSKLRAQALEDQFRDSRGNRRCNLDPGFLGLHNFILATHKGYTHRIYLGRGIYADLTLIYRGGTFCPLEWTYPDYASAPMIDLLNTVRSVFRWQRGRSMKG
jgi:hypothetical protein